MAINMPLNTNVAIIRLSKHINLARYICDADTRDEEVLHEFCAG